MRKIFIVTGANGFLGNNIVRKLLEQNVEVRCLVLPNDNIKALEGLNCKIYKGYAQEACGAPRHYVEAPRPSGDKGLLREEIGVQGPHPGRSASPHGKALQRDRSQIRPAQGRIGPGRRLHPHLPFGREARRRIRRGDNRISLIVHKNAAQAVRGIFRESEGSSRAESGRYPLKRNGKIRLMEERGNGLCADCVNFLNKKLQFYC